MVSSLEGDSMIPDQVIDCLKNKFHFLKNR